MVRWVLDGPCQEVKLLSDCRRGLVTQRKRVVNRLRLVLHELDRACSSAWRAAPLLRHQRRPSRAP
jgi:hypothetical protein